MDTRTQNEQDESSIYTGSMPDAAMPNGTDQEEKKDDSKLRKKYHSSAMYAANVWHNTVSHVKAHSHKAQDM